MKDPTGHHLFGFGAAVDSLSSLLSLSLFSEASLCLPLLFFIIEKAKLLGGYNQIRLVYAWTFSLSLLFSFAPLLFLCILPVEGQERIGPFSY